MQFPALLFLLAHSLQLPAAQTGQAPAFQVLDMVIGTGKMAMAGDKVTVDYTGNLLNGKVFDSSSERAPLTFVLGEGAVIKGWDAGIPGMKVGGRRILSIPSVMAYGDKETASIPANSTLVFDVKLLRVDKKGEQPKLEIEELKAGTGDPCKAGDTVEVHYKGMFLNGAVFDEGTFPFQLGAKKVIAGFDEGVTGMKVGQKRRITVPSEMGYGAKGAGGVIPPDCTLIFEIELSKINGKTPSPSG